MKKNEKILILVLIIILAIVIGIKVKSGNNAGSEINNDEVIEENIVEEFVTVLEDGTKLNTSDKLNQAKEVNGLKFENIQLTEQNGQTVLLANVTNNSGAAIDYTLVDVILLDKEGNEVITVGGIISPLQPGEQTQFNTSMTLDYANICDFKIVVK